MLYRYLLLSGLAVAYVSLATAATVPFTTGDLIKASTPAVYYYAEDGKRYVFPTEKTYFSWYKDFSAVKTITDAELAAVSLGGNVTYRPGVQLLKLTSDPKVYAVDAGKTLRWVSNVGTAKLLYGDSWAQEVHDLPDPFFINYVVGNALTLSTDYNSTTVRDLYSTIQSTLRAEVTAVPAPIVSAPITVTSEATLTLSKTSAIAGDLVTLTATAKHSSGITKIELFFDGVLIKTCAAASVCTDETRIPVSGTKAKYEAKVLVTALDTATLTQTATVTIDASSSNATKILIGRERIRSGQLGEVIIEAMLQSMWCARIFIKTVIPPRRVPRPSANAAGAIRWLTQSAQSTNFMEWSRTVWAALIALKPKPLPSTPMTARLFLFPPIRI
jgi:hypothetical protein